MSIDPFRLAEATAGAGLALGSATLPVAWHALSPGLAGVLAAVWVMLTSGVYALHAVTFDCFRLTGQHRFRHRRRNFSFTRSEE
ncbi:hypothetical protein ODJ79_26890 [Actinoplanes sp. KI2]|uniref:hypothetical protein n=1 Tax=Actinoplanes sp. KI2 TaxID=2983315 RepID=UPI0021D5EA8A|nr:hypothetical protein [Actinoplanes sp. KI2]MCU7727374.1 hypothetical protein [Actinoplanes sp. KI2]